MGGPEVRVGAAVWGAADCGVLRLVLRVGCCGVGWCCVWCWVLGAACGAGCWVLRLVLRLVLGAAAGAAAGAGCCGC